MLRSQPAFTMNFNARLFDALNAVDLAAKLLCCIDFRAECLQ